MPADVVPWSYELQLRYRDLDSFGHVTGAVHMELVVEGRGAWAAEVFCEPDPFFVVARQELDFHLELTYDTRQVEVQVEVSDIGGASFRTVERIISAAGLHTTSAAVLVRWDRYLRRASPLTDDERSRMATHLRR